ncbi:hypothetical protein BH20CHL4_BH20CHL4_10730 [soil metagenome]
MLRQSLTPRLCFDQLPGRGGHRPDTGIAALDFESLVPAVIALIGLSIRNDERGNVRGLCPNLVRQAAAGRRIATGGLPKPVSTDRRTASGDFEVGSEQIALAGKT